METLQECIKRLSCLWLSQIHTASVEQKNEVGLAYISKALNLDDDTIKLFVHGDRNAYHRVGMKQAGVEHHTPDFDGFWHRIGEIFPGVYSPEDISFLIRQGDISAIWHFLWLLEIPLQEESPILRMLAVNAHAYK